MFTWAVELRLDASLHGAVDRGEIVARFQPQLDLATKHVASVEALARWHHPQIGLVLPEKFISLAEANGLIFEIGEVILHQACSIAARSAEGGRPLEVAVNISVVQLASNTLPRLIERLLQEYRLPATALILELTESRLIKNIPQLTRELQKLLDLGVSISLDDFGTGYSSLSYLHDLPVTELKIDRSFVHKDGRTGEILIGSITNLAHDLGLRVVAEGVETQQHLDLVRRLGCDRAQGYFVGKPMTAAALEDWIPTK